MAKTTPTLPIYEWLIEPDSLPPVPPEAISAFLEQTAAATQALTEALNALHAAIDRFPPSTRPHLQVQITHPTPGKA